MDMSTITLALDGVGVPVHEGYPPTGAQLPHIVHRPLLGDAGELSVGGGALAWDIQFYAYCCAASVEASYNLARAVVGTLQGKRVGDSTLATSIGYSGAPVEGHYETQVTIQSHQGEM